MRDESRPPKLTAAVVVGEQRERAERCLASLLDQTALASMEVVLLDLSPAAGALRGADHPAVRHVCRPDLQHFGAARTECVRQARGEIIAFIEDHCFACREWAALIIDAFRRPVTMVNYAFTTANPERYVSRAFMFTEYGRWMVPARPGPVKIAASHNISYRREALIPYLDRLDRLFEAEYLLHRQIQRSGGTVWLEPGAKVAHESWVRFADGCRANGAIKRVLAAHRVAEENLPRIRCLFYAAAMAFTVPVHLWRQAKSVWNRPSLWPMFLSSLPVSVLVYSYGAYQEALGYLFGEGTSRQEYFARELSTGRKA